MKRFCLLLAVIFILSLFSGCSRKGEERFIFSVNEDYATLVTFNGNGGHVKIPSSYDGKPVTHIADRAFYHGDRIDTVILPKDMTNVSRDSFELCVSLKNIAVEENNETFTSFEGVLFSKDFTTLVRCPQGKAGEYTVPDSVTAIADNAFSDCSQLTAIRLPKALTAVGSEAFEGCNRLETLTIPDAVTSIGEKAFSSCSRLRGLHLPAGLQVISSAVFADCVSLKKVFIPDAVTAVNEMAFWNCTDLTDIVVTDNHPCFSSTDGVLFSKDKSELLVYPAGKEEETYFVPPSVNRIASEAFAFQSHLMSITLPGRLSTVFPLTFYRCTALHRVVLEKGITHIQEKAFDSCIALTSLSLPDGLQTIGDAAFRNNESLPSLIVPPSVVAIGSEAFRYCDSLMVVSLPQDIQSIAANSFDTPSNSTSAMPTGSTGTISTDASDYLICS